MLNSAAQLALWQMQCGQMPMLPFSMMQPLMAPPPPLVAGQMPPMMQTSPSSSKQDKTTFTVASLLDLSKKSSGKAEALKGKTDICPIALKSESADQLNNATHQDQLPPARTKSRAKSRKRTAASSNNGEASERRQSPTVSENADFDSCALSCLTFVSEQTRLYSDRTKSNIISAFSKTATSTHRIHLRTISGVGEQIQAYTLSQRL